jgi:hypothetical protein
MEAFHTLHAPASFYKIIFYIYYITKSPYFNLIIAKKKKKKKPRQKYEKALRRQPKKFCI